MIALFNFIITQHQHVKRKKKHPVSHYLNANNHKKEDETKDRLEINLKQFFVNKICLKRPFRYWNAQKYFNTKFLIETCKFAAIF